MEKIKLLHSFVSKGSYQEFVEAILKLARQRISSYVCVANVHMFIEAYRDKSFRSILDNADIVTPDGMPLAVSLKLLDGIKQDRVAGMDLMPSLMAQAEKESLSVFFYGSTPEVLNAIEEKVRKEFPALCLAGFISPPFRALTNSESEDIINRINTSGANMVFVALGCPKQERWMAENRGKIHACMLGLGGAFPVYAGVQKRAPVWMQKSSLEWMYRLMQEPGRLWKRYTVTNGLYILLVMKRLVGGK